MTNHILFQTGYDNYRKECIPMTKKTKQTQADLPQGLPLVPVYQTVPPTQNKPTETEDILDISTFDPDTGINITEVKSNNLKVKRKDGSKR